MKYELDNIEYDVIITKKNNKNLYIRFKDDMKIHVTCNSFITKGMIKKVLDENKNSLRRMIKTVEKKQEKSDKLFYLGKPYDIIYQEDIKDTIINGYQIITKNEKTFNKWYKEETLRVFDERYVYIFNKFKENVKSPILKIREMKTRWGVYNRLKHTITLNSKLIEFDVEKIDYVIIHELSHIIHFNHSKSFWNLVSKYCSNYREIRKEMRD